MSDPNAPGPTLIVRHTGQVFPLTHFPIAIGRQADNTIILADPEVSHLHAIISWRAGDYTVEDAGSANGTYVNERRITGSRPLRHGSVLRVGNTIFDVRIPPSAELIPQAPSETTDAPVPPSAGPRGRPALPVILGLLLGGFVVVCIVTAAILFLMDQRRGEPTITLQSPKQGTQVVTGQSILLQATAAGARNITRLELSVDGVVVGSAQSTDTNGQATLTASQTWTFGQAGTYTVTAVAYTAGNRTSAPVSHQVLVVDSGGRGTPSPTLSETPATASPSATASPASTETPTPTGTPTVLPMPVIEFFRADPDTINLGECSTLQWGQVADAVAATIDHGIGGVGTPGSQLICPTETTEYVMTASGPGGVVTASTTVTVHAGLPDLTVESITFSPNPPVQGKDTEVQIEMRNTGNAAAGFFAWEWQPGSADPIPGSLPSGLGAGASTVVSLTWRPDSPYTELVTVARMDVGNVIAESDETNNELRQTIQVVPPSTTTVTLKSQANLDGYVIGGHGAFASREILVGNISSAEERVCRGFLSFGLVEIPANASIESMELRFFQVSIEGEPYAKLGNLLLKHVDYGPSLDASDFDAAELGSAILPSVTVTGTWYTVSAAALSSWLDQDRSAGRSWTQLRLQFTTEKDGDVLPDYIQLESGDNSLGKGNVPELIVTYSMP